jgi:hypothetical protein
MTVTIPDDARAKLLSSIADFINPLNADRRHTLREFQALASYVNWALNVYPSGAQGSPPYTPKQPANPELMHVSM